MIAQKLEGRRPACSEPFASRSGRALHILSAVHLAADALRGYTLRITLASPEVKEMAMAVAEADGGSPPRDPADPRGEQRHGVLRPPSPVGFPAAKGSSPQCRGRHTDLRRSPAGVRPCGLVLQAGETFDPGSTCRVEVFPSRPGRTREARTRPWTQFLPAYRNAAGKK